MGFVSFVTTRLRDNSMRSASGLAENYGPGGGASPRANFTNLGEPDDVLLAERTRIAQELHDTLLQGFFAASLHLSAAAERLPADSPAKPQLDDVRRLVDRTLEEGRRAVQGLRSPGRPMGSLGEAFAGVPNDLGLQPSVAFQVVVHGRERQLRAGLFEEVYRIGREAILNAYRHSKAEHIEAEIEYGSKELRIAVRDNGCGIDHHHLHWNWHGRWGLRGMRERAERIGARLRLLSKTALGTEVELRVPGRVAFEDGVSFR